MNSKGIIQVLAAGLMLLFIHSIHAQCKPFIKKSCMPKLAPYTSDGQLNNAQLRAGEVAELEFTFYSGQEYRIYVCAQEVLGAVAFKLMDSNRNILFNSKNGKNPYWDFHIESTQQMILEVSTPDSSDPIIPSGCVAVMVGFKDTKK